ncbi:hypothetical protein ACFWCB_26395 [Streptomyces sp. NPDC060048]|uniref:hypothetical protein n=1 Tax=unclassified Streptomyces TaxID=2593676 RepID=UPI0036853CF2
MQEINVRRAADFYTPPPSRRPGAWDLVAPAERVWHWYEHQMQRRLTPPTAFLIGASIYARINHGRWVADCVCGSAQVVTPEDPRLACPECGYGWARVVFPEDTAAAEATVTALPPHERNWWHPDDQAWDRVVQPARPDPEPGEPDTPAPDTEQRKEVR